MSKCKAVLDGEKITEIQVKAKTRESQLKDKPEPKTSGESNQASLSRQQSE